MFFDNRRITLYFDTFELRMAKTLQLRFGFAHHCGIFLLRHKYVIYLFNVVTFFDNVRIPLYFDTFELHMKYRNNYVASLLAIVTSFLLRYLFIRCSYAF